MTGPKRLVRCAGERSAAAPETAERQAVPMVEEQILGALALEDALEHRHQRRADLDDAPRTDLRDPLAVAAVAAGLLFDGDGAPLKVDRAAAHVEDFGRSRAGEQAEADHVG